MKASLTSLGLQKTEANFEYSDCLRVWGTECFGFFLGIFLVMENRTLWSPSLSANVYIVDVFLLGLEGAICSQN